MPTGTYILKSASELASANHCAATSLYKPASRSFLNPLLTMNGSADPSSFMDVKGEWVRYKDCNVLWLPPNRRPGVYAFRDHYLSTIPPQQLSATAHFWMPLVTFALENLVWVTIQHRISRSTYKYWCGSRTWMTGWHASSGWYADLQIV